MYKHQLTSLVLNTQGQTPIYLENIFSFYSCAHKLWKLENLTASSDDTYAVETAI